MRIDEIEVGDELTDERTHYAYDVRPRRYRAEEIVFTEEPAGGYRGGTRQVRKVRLVEVNADTGEDYPEGHQITRGRAPHTFTEAARTGRLMAARDLEPYKPAAETWAAYAAVAREVHRVAKALGAVLPEGVERLRPHVVGNGTEGRLFRGEVELVLTVDGASLLAGQCQLGQAIADNALDAAEASGG